MREANLQASILKALRRHGGWWVKFHAGPRYSLRGVPDILGCYLGRFIAFEVKRPGEKPTKLQAETHKLMREQGKAIVRVVSTVDEALDLLYVMERRKPDGKACARRRSEPGRA